MMEYCRVQNEKTSYVSVNSLIQPKKCHDTCAYPPYAPEEQKKPNTTTGGLLSEAPPGLSKLKVSQSGDASEIEADRVACEVVDGHTIPLEQQSSGNTVQAKLGVMTSPQVPSGSKHTGVRINDESQMGQAIASGGYPLSGQTKGFFKAKMGLDFSDVRIHNNRDAYESAVAINAKAYTIGNDIIFAEGQYNPDSRDGKLLLAHELTHVMQGGEGINKKDNQNGDKARDTGRATAGVIEAEAILREVYRRTDEAIVREAEYMLSKGVPTNEVAKWVIDARNEAKVKIRKWDLDVLRLLAEKSNEKIYGNEIGPSYTDLRTGTRNNKPGVKPPKTDLEIIEGAKVTRASVNKWLGRFRIAGRIMIAIDIGISGWRVIVAAPEDRPKVLIRESSRFAGALAGGWAGAKVGGAIGGGVGAWFGGAGAIPGAAIGAVIGGVAGAIGGGYLGQAVGNVLIYQLYPPKNTGFEGGFQ
jgi:hypothetical protein